MIDNLTKADFTGLLQCAIDVEGNEHLTTLRVATVRDLPPGSPRPEPFAVELEGPPEPLLPQGVYTFVLPHGRAGLFMVPIARNAQCARYEIIFN